MTIFYPGITSSALNGRTLSPAIPVVESPATQVVAINLLGTAANSADVAVTVSTAAGKGGEASVRLFRNGLLVKRWQHVDLPSPSGNVTLDWKVRLVPGMNHLISYSYDEQGKKSADATLDCEGPKTVPPGVLHLLMVGINTYKSDPSLQLTYAEADANLMGEVFAAQRAQINREEQEMVSHPEWKYAPEDRETIDRASGPVDLRPLLSAKATRKNILNTIAKLVSEAQPQDTIIIFFAGHGITRGKTFYFPASDISGFDERYTLDTVPEQILASGSISDKDLEAALEPLDVRSSALIMDACESGQLLLASTDTRRGQVDAHGFAQLAFEKGIALLAAAPSKSEAKEGSDIGHGWLTYALAFQGLENAKARVSEVNGNIYLGDLLSYADKEVPKYIAQRPALYVPSESYVARTLVGMGPVTLQPESGKLLSSEIRAPALSSPTSSSRTGLILSYDVKNEHPSLITSIVFANGQLIVTTADKAGFDVTRWSSESESGKTLNVGWKSFSNTGDSDIAVWLTDGQLLAVNPTNLNSHPLPDALQSANNIVMGSGLAAVQFPGGASGGSLQGWDTINGKLLWSKPNSYLGLSSISSGGKVMALNFGRDIALLEGETGKQLWPPVEFPQRTGLDGFSACSLTDDGTLLASGSLGGQATVTIWNLSAAPADRAVWATAGNEWVQRLAFAPKQPDESQQGVLAAALLDGSISVYHWQSKVPIQHYFSGGPHVSVLSFSADGNILASGTVEGIVSIFDLRRQVLLLRLRWIDSAGMWIAQDGLGHFDAPKNTWDRLVWTDGNGKTPVDPRDYRGSIATKVLGGVLTRQR